MFATRRAAPLFVVSALLLSLLACTSLIGADWDRPLRDDGASFDAADVEPLQDAGDAGASEGGTTAPGPTLLYGGCNGTTLFDDTWEWDGELWLRYIQSGPGRLAFPGMASLGGRVTLFGGRGCFDCFDGAADGTWVWDGATWTKQTIDGGPSRREDPAMITLGSRIVLVGGYRASSATSVDDTWEWNGARWMQLGGTVRTYGGALASLRNRPVLFGTLGDTWEWDGAAWNRRETSGGPGSRSGHAMASLGDVVVLFGGNDFDGNVLDDTWTWDGVTWRQLPVRGPRARSQHAMASRGDRIVLFGGMNATRGPVGGLGDALDDTWEWDGQAWSERTVMGPPARYWHAMATR